MKAQKLKNLDFMQSSIRAPIPIIRAPNSSHQKTSLVRKKLGPELDHSGADLTDLGNAFLDLGPKFLGSGADFHWLINRKMRFQNKGS
jgi:hypothetical protein